jgi:UTP--glucose-1-phosphate uridylyltransferase
MVRKAVIPAAGFGTRFLPATKSQPKEMLPVVDIPVIQYVVEEAVASGITDILMIIGRGKRAIEEHFDRSFELEAELEAKGKIKELESIRRLSNLANIHFIWQKQMLGLGDAIRCARHHVGDEPFAVLLGDTIVHGKPPATKQLLDVFRKYGTSVVALEEVSRDRVSRYGVVAPEPIDDRVCRVVDLVEKPAPDQAPSNLAIASRYILTPDIFELLDQVKPGKGGEIQITDALRMQAHRKPIHGCRVHARRLDIGNTLGFIKANILLGLERSDLQRELAAFLQEEAETIRKAAHPVEP